MTKEDGRPYRVDPHTLATLGRYDFGGRLRSQTVTAHVRIDPHTGELFFFGYEADGLASTKVAYCIADRHGNLVREQWFDAPYCAMMHDFTITQNYALFPVYPTTCDLERLKAGRRSLGARAAARQLGGRHAALRLGGRDALVPGTQGRVLLSHDERVRGRRRAHSARSVPLQRECVSLHPARLGPATWRPGETGARLARWTIDLQRRQRPRDRDGDRAARATCR